MSLITPPPRTSSLVYDRMRELIRSGAWAVGSRIPPEGDLVRDFGVGRNTIREAVRALEHAGLLVPRRGDGTYVRSRNPLTAAIEQCSPTVELSDLLATRRALESEAAAAAAVRATTDEVYAIRTHLTAAQEALDGGDIDRHVAADLRFHTAIVAASSNALLIELYDGIGEAMRRSHPSLAAATSAHDDYPEGHAAVLDAIADGDANAARAAVFRYVDDALAAIE